MVSSPRVEGEVLVEYYRKLATPKPNNRFDTEFEKEINTGRGDDYHDGRPI